jgi:Zn-dependent protease
MENLQYVLLAFPIMLLSLSAHEFAHAWVALKQGDDTAYMLGRVTLNPAAHIDPIGTILFPLIGMLTGAPLLGWAKPVPTNPRKYREYVRGDVLVSLAGVIANAILAVCFGVLAAVLLAVQARMAAPVPVLETATQMMVVGVFANAGLIVFNLLPIPPLDGSHVFYHMLPANLGASYRQLYPYGFIILWGLVLTGALDFLVPAIRALAGLFLLPAALAGA